MWYTKINFVVVVQLVSCVQIFVTPGAASHQASLSFTISWVFLKVMAIQPSHSLLPLLLLPSIFPSISAFSYELALCIRQSKLLEFQHQSFKWIFRKKTTTTKKMNIQGFFDFFFFFFFLGLTGLILLSKVLSRVFCSTIIWKHQFFGAQPSLWSNSHICTWLLEKT